MFRDSGIAAAFHFALQLLAPIGCSSQTETVPYAEPPILKPNPQGVYELRLGPTEVSIGGQRFFGFHRTHESDRQADHGRGLRCAGVEHFEQAEQGRRRIADGDDGAGQAVAPEFHRSG